jgi:SWI/SNF-related matrix-associated actin-dependent regulator 1 of chromatin subfamily A
MAQLTLYPYQKIGVDFLLQHRGGLLLDEQGLGKTIQALVAVRKLLTSFTSEPENRLIIVCPAVMQATWKVHSEAILGDLKHYAKICIHSYEWYSKTDNLKSVVLDIKKTGSKSLVIVDEAHYIKTPTSLRTQAVITLLSLPETIFRVLLTGTPITRDIDDLYIPLKVFHAHDQYLHYPKSIYEYRKRFMCCIHTFFGDKYKGYRSESAKDYIKSLLKNCALRRTKSSVGLNLPPIIRTPVYIDINKSVAKESLTILDYAIKVISGDDSYTIYKTDLEEEASHVATIRKALGVAKVPQTIAYVQTLVDANITKFIIFAVHIDVVKLLAESLKTKFKSYTVHAITGATSMTNRNNIIDSFQNDSAPQILVANMQACGVGVTLTAAHTVVFAEIDFTPSTMMQAEARVHRITQNSSVSSVYLLANNSLDVKIMDLIKTKMEIIKETLK